MKKEILGKSALDTVKFIEEEKTRFCKEGILTNQFNIFLPTNSSSLLPGGQAREVTSLVE